MYLQTYQKNEKTTTRTRAEKAVEKAKQRAKIKSIKPKGHWTQRLGYGVLPNDPKLTYEFLSTLEDEDKVAWDNLPQELKDLIGVAKPGGAHPEINFDEFSMMAQVPGYGQYLKDRGIPGVEHSGNVGNLGDRYVKYTGELDKYGKKIKATDTYGNTLYGYHEANWWRWWRPTLMGETRIWK